MFEIMADHPTEIAKQWPAKNTFNSLFKNKDTTGSMSQKKKKT